MEGADHFPEVHDCGGRFPGVLPGNFSMPPNNIALVGVPSASLA